MNDQLVKEFGPVLAAHVLPIEVEHRDCPDTLFPVILLLRLLLGKSVSGVFYKTMWEADDGDTHYTDIFVYDAGHRQASLKKIASAHVDTAIHLSWEREREGWRYDTSSYQNSYGVIRWLSIDTALGATTADAKDAVLTLLRLAASTSNDYELLVETVQDGVISLKLRSYKTEAQELIDVGLLHWSTVEDSGHRFFDNRGDCAFELKK